MSRGYLPETLQGLREWALSFCNLVVDQPANYGVSPADATALGDKFDAYNNALNVSTTPATRTRPTIQTTQTCKAELIAAIRPIVNTIQSFPGTTNTMRRDLGITVRKSPAPAPIPATAPVVTITGVTGNTIAVKLQDADDLDRRAKPAGVKGANLFWYVGAVPPNEPAGWTFVGSTTRTTTTMTLPDSVPGAASVWVTAFWFNANTASGPAATPVQTWTQVTPSNPAGPGSGQTIEEDQQPRLAA
ncbi:MAG: hypothetical protein AAGF84_07055 [Planctomycetota bacterium]